MKALVLAEKPSVAKEIARVLGCTQKQKSYIEGPKYVVTWALGHLVGLAEPEDYDPNYQTWRLEDLPILPERMKLKVLKETNHQYRAIAQLAKRADLDELIIATDAGREGELVARWIMEMVRWKKPFRRLWISSQTDTAIKDGFRKLQPGAAYTPLFHSAICRAEADWLIGLNVTRALTSKYNAQLSAGRVQTPTLAMIMAREEEIRRFRPTPYWTLQCDFGSLQAIWRHPGNNSSQIFDAAQAEALRQKLQGKSGKITDIRETAKQEPHPLAYDLTELQRDANKRYGFSAKQTSNSLQRLYEQHKLVTYPRTDSRYLSADMADTLAERLERIAVGPYASLARPLLRKKLTLGKRIIDDSKVTDHHAIIPTEQHVQLQNLSNDERKVYDLIVRRYISLFYPPYKYVDTRLTIGVEGETVHASGRVIQDKGWKEVYESTGVSFLEDNGENQDLSDDDPKGQQLPALKVGDRLPPNRTKEMNHQTRPPSRYNEASLLTQMEKHNLGTPATRADIIEKLVSSDTIERQGNALAPTRKGSQLIELASEELRSPELTAQWELQLEKIAKGRGDMKQFLAGIREQATKLVQEIKTSNAEYKPHNLTHSKCPSCSAFLQEIKTKRGRMLVCPDRECGHRRPADPPLSNKRCPQCRKKMEIHNGKAGKYAQCRPCNIVETLDSTRSNARNRRDRDRDNNKLIKQYSDNTTLTSNLGDLLKKALEDQ